VTSRLDALGLVLLRPTPISLSSQRWLVSSLRIYPRINLAIQPILRDTVIRQQSGYWSGAPGLPIAPAAVLMRAATMNVAAQPDSQRVTEIERERSDESAIVGRELGLALQTPLARVFSLLRKAEVSLPKTTGQNAEQVAGRVTRRSRRVEERSLVASSAVTRQAAMAIERETKVGIERTESKLSRRLPEQTSAWEVNQPSVASRPDTWQQGVAQTAQFEIEQLADQVMRQLDRRFVAQRERMGKVR
jgi:hypothetical protein